MTAPVDPILLEIVEGTLASVEREVETAIARTARSPMIRDAHDFRAGIHDRRLRKLTGRSYSALVQPVARDFPIGEMRPGDVFFHNDVYLSEGGIGHLPDLCVTVPVFHDGEVVAFVQAFGSNSNIRASHQEYKLASMGQTPRPSLLTGQTGNTNREYERRPGHRRPAIGGRRRGGRCCRCPDR